MGCEESRMMSNTDLDLEVPAKVNKTPNRKKNANEPVHGRHSA